MHEWDKLLEIARSVPRESTQNNAVAYWAKRFATIFNSCVFSTEESILHSMKSKNLKLSWELTVSVIAFFEPVACHFSLEIKQNQHISSESITEKEIKF